MLALFSLSFFSIAILAQPTDRQTGKWGDQGDGTYRNPILPSDYSDPDVVRVGTDYYLIASTFHLSPGMVIMHSKDLVNWETISYATPNISALGESMNYTKMAEYDRGIYAGSIRYHNDSFHICYTTLHHGIFISKAKNITGPWVTELLKDKFGRPITAKWWDDPCPLWDDDGKAYFVASKLQGGWTPRLFRMNDAGTQLLDADNDSMSVSGKCKSGDGTMYCDKRTGEGNKLYRINGWYYLYHNQVTQPEHYRVSIMHRSKCLYGIHEDGTPGSPDHPGKYEEKKMLHNAVTTDLEPNQGGLVETPDGKWYFLTQQGKGSAWGRADNLLPVQWIDGWPIPGIPDKDTIGTIQWQAKKPVNGFATTFPQGSDEFENSVLNPKWQWNYEPKPKMYSLTERKGWLRLHAYQPLKPDSFFYAGSTICQRYFKCDTVTATIKMDITKMQDGQEAGFAHFNGSVSYSSIGVSQKDGMRRLRFDNNHKVDYYDTIPSTVKVIYLRTTVDANLISHFEYSIDGTGFTQLGNTYLLRWGKYRGDYMGIYNYNNLFEKGFIDIDWFHYVFKNR